MGKRYLLSADLNYQPVKLEKMYS
ncbi:LEPR-XLL domain-containing protein [Psychrobacter sp. UBA6766]